RLPLLGACLPLPAPLGGDTGCQPSGTNPSCAPGADLAPAMGGNVEVLKGHEPLLSSEDTITADSQGRLALGFIGVDSQGNSYMGVAQSTGDGKRWPDKGRMPASSPTQSDPVLVTTKLPDVSATHARMHYLSVVYTIHT